MDQFDIVSFAYKQFVEQDPFRNHMHYPGVLDHLKTKPGDVVLDIGCGDGFFDTLLSEKLGVTVLGYDSSEQQIITAQNRGDDGNSYIVAAPETFKTSEYFSAALSVLVLPYAIDKAHLKEFFASAFKHIKIGCSFISVVFNPDFIDFDIDIGSRRFEKLDKLTVKVNFLILPDKKIALTSRLNQFSGKDYEEAACLVGFKTTSWFDLESDILGVEKYTLDFWGKVHESQPYQIFIAQKI